VIERLDDLIPDVGSAAFVAPNATIVGSVTLGADVSVWYGVVIRGDVAPVTICARTNIQDNSVLHVAGGHPLRIEHDVTIGHGAIVHACTVNAYCLIGMGACILDGAVIPPRCMVGAGTLVPPGKTYPEGSLLVGTPARVVRNLTDEEFHVMESRITEYVENARHFKAGCAPID
jgi:carbonic anhydrase/acetyltransferase-like protein (isoleucine patch superfamily)